MLNKIKLPLIVCALGLMGSTAFAQNWGIRFDQMPVGTEYEVKQNNGDRNVIRYVGKRGKHYIVEDTNLKTGRKVRQKFNLLGHFESVTGQRGLRIKNVPNSCYMVVGNCTHFVSGTTKNTGNYTYSVKQLNATQRSGTWRRITTEETRSFKYTLGKYNIVTYSEYENGSRTISKTVTRISEPNG